MRSKFATNPELSTSRTLVEFSLEIGIPVEEVTALDLLDYGHEDLNNRPTFMSCEAGDILLEDISESEMRRLARIGRMVIDSSAKKIRS